MPDKAPQKRLTFNSEWYAILSKLAILRCCPKYCTIANNFKTLYRLVKHTPWEILVLQPMHVMVNNHPENVLEIFMHSYISRPPCFHALKQQLLHVTALTASDCFMHLGWTQSFHCSITFLQLRFHLSCQTGRHARKHSRVTWDVEGRLLKGKMKTITPQMQISLHLNHTFINHWIICKTPQISNKTKIQIIRLV